MHVIVPGPVDQQQSAGEVRRKIRRRAYLVAVGIVLWSVQDVFSPFGIVITEIRHCRHSDAGLERMGMGHQLQRHAPSAAPSPDPDAVRIHERLFLQPLYAGQNVVDFIFRQAFSMGRVFQDFALAGGAAVVDPEADITVFQ